MDSKHLLRNWYPDPGVSLEMSTDNQGCVEIETTD